MPEDVGKLSLKFGVEKHEIDAVVYGKVLINTVTLIEQTNKELHTNAHFQIRVKAEREGSYLADIVLQAATILGISAPLLTAENFEEAHKFAKTVILFVGQVFETRKKTGGERPNNSVHLEDGTVNITGDNYGTININKTTNNILFENPEAEKAVREIFTALKQENDIEDFSLLDENNQVLFEAERKDFSAMSKKIETVEQTRKVIVDNDAVLSIVRQSFEKEKTSDFIYHNRPITASIGDERFWEAIDRGERFAKGDKLFVDLEIMQDFNKALDVFEDKGYKILVVNQHVPRPEQPNLFRA